MHARRDRTVAAAAGPRGERGNRRSRHGSHAQIEPAWDNTFGEMYKSPASLEASGSREERHMHVSLTREGKRNGSGNAAIPARGPATGRREGAAFVTARGGNEFNTAREGNESEMETARDTARDTARGFETDYMSTIEPDTGRSLSTAFEDEPEPGRGAPAYDFPSHRNSTTNNTGNDVNYGSEGLSRKTGRAPIDRRNARASHNDANSNGREAFAASPARGMTRDGVGGLTWDDEYGHRSRHKAEVHVRRSKHSNLGEGVPVNALNTLKRDEQKQFVFRQDLVEDIFSYARHNRVEDLERMMDHGVPADVRDDHGNTILIVACQNGHKRALKAALRRGADINATNARGNTALHFCYTFGYGDTLGQYLVDKGASSSIRNRSGLVCYDGIDR